MSGYVKDSKSGEVLIGVNVFITGLIILGIAFRSKDKFSDKEELRKRIDYDQYKPKSTSRPSW